MDVLILQHIACEPPGVYEDVLVERGARITRVELDEGEPMPPHEGFAAIIAMGGPMSVNDEGEHPWLVEEKRVIAAATRGGLPFWGACLGVQLLAAALCAPVYPGPAPEVGVLPVTLTDEGRNDPVTRALPDEVFAVQWHGDTFDLPESATLLASSSAYPNQALRVANSYGVQFHLEVSRSMAEEWAGVPAYGEYADRVLGRGSMPRLIDAVGDGADAMRDHGKRMFEAWLDSTVDGHA